MENLFGRHPLVYRLRGRYPAGSAATRPVGGDIGLHAQHDPFDCRWPMRAYHGSELAADEWVNQMTPALFGRFPTTVASLMLIGRTRIPERDCQERRAACTIRTSGSFPLKARPYWALGLTSVCYWQDRGIRMLLSLYTARFSQKRHPYVAYGTPIVVEPGQRCLFVLALVAPAQTMKLDLYQSDNRTTAGSNSLHPYVTISHWMEAHPSRFHEYHDVATANSTPVDPAIFDWQGS